MTITDKRGADMARLGMENRKKIWDYFAAHPCATQSDAAESLGIHKNSISKHVRAIRAGWKPVGAEA